MLWIETVNNFLNSKSLRAKPILKLYDDIAWKTRTFNRLCNYDVSFEFRNVLKYVVIVCKDSVS